MNYSANINGIEYSVRYSDALVDGTLIPLLRHLSQLHTEKGSRVIVMLAAPPGTGKSTLVSFLEYLAKSVIPDKRVQSVGMDGFHLRQEYLLTHTVEVNGEAIPMARIKGASIGKSDFILSVCSGDMLFNVFDEYLGFLSDDE